MKKAVIILPTYNEEGDIGNLIETIFIQTNKIKNWEIEILVVDSKSKDKTAVIVKEKIIKFTGKVYLLETEKEGLGKAYVRGFDYAINKLKAYVIFEMDADLSHPPDKIHELLKTIEQGADLALGSRYIKGGSIPSNWAIHRKIFSIVSNLIIRLGFMKLKINDWTGGYRAIKVWVIKKVLPKVNNYSGYVFQIAFLDNAIKSGAKIKEVPFHFSDRTYGVSKINPAQYIVQILMYVFLNSSFIKFVIVGFTGFFIDFGFAYFFINTLRFPKAPSNMLSAEMAIISNFFLNNFWSFKHKKIGGGALSYIVKFFSFNFVSLGAIIIQGVGLTLCLKFFGDSSIRLLNVISLQSWIIYKIFLIAFLVIPYSYILYNKVVWKEK